MDVPERDTMDHHKVTRNVTKSSLPDSAPGSIRELDALSDQSPIAMIFFDCELRVRRTNAAFRRLAGLPSSIPARRALSARVAGQVRTCLGRVLTRWRGSWWPTGMTW